MPLESAGAPSVQDNRDAGRAAKDDRDDRVNRIWTGAFTDPGTQESVTISPDYRVTTRPPKDDRRGFGAFATPSQEKLGFLNMMAPGFLTPAIYLGNKFGGDFTTEDKAKLSKLEASHRDRDIRDPLKSLMSTISGDTPEEEPSVIQGIIDRILSRGTAPTPGPAPTSTQFNPLTYGQPGSAYAFDFFSGTPGPRPTTPQPTSSPQGAFRIGSG